MIELENLIDKQLLANYHDSLMTNVVEPLKNEAISSAMNVSYAQLVQMRTQGTLKAGQYYRITDYVTTTVQTDTQSAGHQFDVIVRADSSNVLNEDAQAALHSGDEYFSTAGAKLEAWELKYCLDNDTTKFEWADATNGKGVIWWMKDEFDNECPYDFKNIQFRWNSNIFQNNIKADVFYYTFSATLDDIDISDNSLNKNHCYNNKIEKRIKGSNKRSLNFIVFRNTLYSSNCYNNTFGNNCYNNTFGHSSSYNTFGYFCYNNTFGFTCSNNTFGNNCYNNTFVYNFVNNTFRYGCHDNIFMDNCYNNTFGYGCSFNMFGQYCDNNTFGDYCQQLKKENFSNQTIESFQKDIYINKAKEIFFDTDEIYQNKDKSVYPVSHPDLSTQPSILPQRFGNLPIKEVLIAKGRESEIPHDAMVISAFSFNAKECCAAVCRNENGLWKISNSENIVPDFTLIRYVGADTGYYYTSGGEEEPFDETVDDTDDGTLVDLGLPSGLLWAKSNIGANVPSDYGLYFAWGETEGHADTSGTKKFSWDDYKFGTQNNLTKYNATDGLTTLQAEDDAVTQMYGEGYRMPTREELEELYTNTRHKWITLPNGVSGRKFVSLKDPSKYIFIPASGNCSYGSRSRVGGSCDLWSSSVYSSGRGYAWNFYFDSGSIGMNYGGRCYGQSVRGVGGKN